MTRSKLRSLLIAGVFLTASAACSQPQQTAEQTVEAPDQSRSVNVYTARHYASDRAVYAQFTEQTGIEINLVEASGDLMIERIRADGERSPADVLVTVDAGRLWRAEQAGILEAAPELDAQIDTLPSALVHPGKAWFGFSTRVRGIAYAVDRVDPSQITDFLDLADPAYAGRICVRSSDNVYNQSLLAALIDAIGAEAAEEWAAGIAANLARTPQGGDTDQIRAIAADECDVAIVNHYYAVRLERSDAPADQEVAAATEFMIPSLGGAGSHVNISGAGLAAGAPNRAEAIEFLTFMLTAEAQRTFPELTNEYPIVPGTEYDNVILEGLSMVAPSEVNVDILGENAAEAQRIFDRVGWP